MNKITKEVNQEIREERGREVETGDMKHPLQDIKNRVLIMLKEQFDHKDEKQFNEFLKEDYNAYDNETMISEIFCVVSDVVNYDYNSSPTFNSYGQVSYWSRTIRKTVMLTQDDDFWYQTLDEIIEAILGYEVEVKQVEYNMKHNKGGE